MRIVIEIKTEKNGFKVWDRPSYRMIFLYFNSGSGSGMLRLVHSMTLRASPALFPIILKICLNFESTAKMGNGGYQNLKT